MRMTAVHERFGVEVRGVDLRGVTASDGYPEVRAVFEENSVLVFRDQELDDGAHLRFGGLFGPIEVRSKNQADKAVVSPLTNLGDDATIIPEDDRQVMNLKANQLWHTDSTFLPAPALINVLAARVLPSSGGETEYASTRAAWADMPAGLKDRARGAVLRHRYAHSRAKISPELATGDLFTMWSDQAWPAVWRNPINGREALYIASHAYAVEGMGDAAGSALIEELTAFATRPEYVYTHRWQPGDVLLWDERATLHRGRPWPYGEERTLASICVTARDCDGLAAMRPGG
ncbi:MAG: TauD/TfdA family dioxygenase [Alphaproteobacteria bacterium]|nr:TauD/TfdA family dioxygenase [Alphaproteobacteria bacterium]